MEKLDKVELIKTLRCCASRDLDICAKECPVYTREEFLKNGASFCYKVCAEAADRLEELLKKQDILRAELAEERERSARWLRESEPVVHAHWVHDANNLYGCSNCLGRETMSPKKLKNYCPHCGAHMDEKLELRTCYCPFCDKHFEVSVNDKQGSCPGCGRHVALRGVEVSYV